MHCKNKIHIINIVSESNPKMAHWMALLECMLDSNSFVESRKCKSTDI